MVLDRGNQHVVIAGRDENGCLDRFQLNARESLPRDPAGFGEQLGHCVGSGATLS
jgi:hypothetical protein